MSGWLVPALSLAAVGVWAAVAWRERRERHALRGWLLLTAVVTLFVTSLVSYPRALDEATARVLVTAERILLLLCGGAILARRVP